MNYIYFGLPADINIGNGKTISGIKKMVEEMAIERKKIYSNIKLFGIDYTPLNPDNLFQILDEGQGAFVFLDELHAIVHKNHKIFERCTKHNTPGLCYLLSEFFRQVRKRDITTVSTCQVWADAHFQLRQLMQESIICEKFRLENNELIKCDGDKCPPDHEHYIMNTNMRTGKKTIFASTPYQGFYDSNEIVKGWVSFV